MNNKKLIIIGLIVLIILMFAYNLIKSKGQLNKLPAEIPAVERNNLSGETNPTIPPEVFEQIGNEGMIGQ